MAGHLTPVAGRAAKSRALDCPKWIDQPPEREAYA